MRTNQMSRRAMTAAGLLLATTLLTTACAAPEFREREGAVTDPTREPDARAGTSAPVIEPSRGSTPTREPSTESAPSPPPQGSEGWRQRRPAAGRIAAYTTRISAPPGVPVGLRVSTTERRYRVSAYRIGSYAGGTGLLVWRSTVLPGREQPPAVLRPVETRTVVAPWRTSVRLDTRDWDPGFYVLRLRTETGWETLVPQIVSSPSAKGTVALGAPVTTWQAYTQWGGYSRYAGPDGDRRSWAVSFDRPFNGATGANDYRTAAIPVIVQAERQGVPLSYYANVDLHEDPSLLEGAAGYVSMGHDEYWTPAMRRAVEAAHDGGTNLAFLGANTMYWRIRLDATRNGPGRLQTGYRSDAAQDPLRTLHPAEATSRFRDAPAAESEQSLVGVQYECFPVHADFVVQSPTWWGFRGTGVRRGDRMHGLVGPEADRVYLNASTPRPMEVLSHTSYSCGGVPTTGQAVYYSTESGAGVFTAGTLRWGCALVDRCDRPLGARVERFVRVVTSNLVRSFARGPVGLEHPARDTVTRYHLPDRNSVGAS